MSALSQILAVGGLFLELLSVAYTAREVFPPKSKKERKKEYMEGLGKTIDQKLEDKTAEWYGVLGLLSIGIILQAIAIFV